MAPSVSSVQLFGAVSSPAVANFSLHGTAESGRAEFGDEAANFIPRNFYVDDDLTSVPSVQEAVTLVKSSQAICASAKFASNCKEVLETLPPEDRTKDLKDLDLRHDALPIQRSLGTYWCIESDTLGFRIELKNKPVSPGCPFYSKFCIRSSWDSFACHPCRETDSTRPLPKKCGLG